MSLLNVNLKLGRLCVGATCVCASAAALGNQGGQAAERARLVDCLRHQERLVTSARVEYISAYTETPPEQIPLIREACRLRGEEDDYVSYIIGSSFVKKNSYKVHWLRKGTKEKWIGYREGSEQGWQRAYDGHLVRSLERGADRVWRGGIRTVESAHWFSQDRHQPFATVFEWYGTPLSEVLQSAEECSLSETSRAGRPCVIVRFRREASDNLIGDLVFDQGCRLVERRVLSSTDGRDNLRLHKVTELSDYREQRLPSGESVYFPYVATSRLFAGHLADGRPVAYTTKTLTIRSLEFNVDIPDEEFVIEFPPGTKMYDGVGGLRWLDKSDRVQQLLDKGLAAIETVKSTTQPGVDANTRPCSPVPLPARTAPATASGSVHPSGWPIVWLALGACLIVAGAVGLLWRRSRSRPPQAR